MTVRARFGLPGSGVIRNSGARMTIRARFGLPGSGLSPGPVSYTHLRAHETVLDLVCRLLIEKKNTHTNTHTQHIIENHMNRYEPMMIDSELITTVTVHDNN